MIGEPGRQIDDGVGLWQEFFRTVLMMCQHFFPLFDDLKRNRRSQRMITIYQRLPFNVYEAKEILGIEHPEFLPCDPD